jgi:hypothetical protein
LPGAITTKTAGQEFTMHVASSPATEYEDLVPLQGAALDIWRQKYQLKNSVGWRV